MKFLTDMVLIFFFVRFYFHKHCSLLTMKFTKSHRNGWVKYAWTITHLLRPSVDLSSHLIAQMYRYIIVNAFYCGIVGVITNDKLCLRVPFKQNWLPIIQILGCSMTHLPRLNSAAISFYIWKYSFWLISFFFQFKISTNICLFIKMEIRAMQKNRYAHMTKKYRDAHTHTRVPQIIIMHCYMYQRRMCKDMQQLQRGAFFLIYIQP